MPPVDVSPRCSPGGPDGHFITRRRAGMIRFRQVPGRRDPQNGSRSGAARAAISGFPAPSCAAIRRALWRAHVFGGPRRRTAHRRPARPRRAAGLNQHENYCASGAACDPGGLGGAFAAGLHDVVLVIGVEKMTDRVAGECAPARRPRRRRQPGHGRRARHERPAVHARPQGYPRGRSPPLPVKRCMPTPSQPLRQYQRVRLEVLAALPIADPLGLLIAARSPTAPQLVMCTRRSLQTTRAERRDAGIWAVAWSAAVSGRLTPVE